MIQDMLANEFFVGAYKNEETWNTNKFSDVAQFPMGPSPDMRVWERRLLYCVPVPGQNTWADSASEGLISTYATSTNREKRQRETCSVSDEMDIQDSGIETPNSPRAKKMREGESVPQDNMTDATDCSTSMVPEFDRNNFPCLVKIYDTPESDLKLNDVFEFIGVLMFDTDVKDDKHGKNEMADCFDEEESVNLPSSKVPRLHCLVHRKLSVNDMISISPTMEPKPDLLRGIRESLLRHLTVVLGDDELAAHFMLLHLLSKVHVRVDTVAVGKLSLNLSGFDKSSISIFGNCINDAIKNLLPYSQRMPLTVDYLNTASLAPMKDYQTNRLVPGVLQCAEGSHLTVDETPLQSGTLNNNGVENACLLKDLMDFQKLRDAEEKVMVLSKEREQLMKERDSSHQEALLWRSELAKARERVVILEGAVVRADEKVRVKEAEAEAAIKEATEKEAAARQENQELLAYINVLQLQLQRQEENTKQVLEERGESCSQVDTQPLTKHVHPSEENVDKACLSVSRNIQVSERSLVHPPPSVDQTRPINDGEWNDIEATEARISDVREIAPDTEGNSLDIPVFVQPNDGQGQEGNAYHPDVHTFGPPDDTQTQQSTDSYHQP